MSCNQNPLDPCTRSFMQCDNPCNTHEPCKELLPTQIDTFITQFFGQLGKANSNGSVAWTLPCGLDSGTSANPRQAGESLACYFLRLMQAGLAGISGLPGEDGQAGVPGPDAFTYTEQDFSQPSVASPYLSVKLHPSASLVTGLYVEIAGSGIYQILNLAADGTALLQLLTALAAEGSVIPSGATVIASGFPGVRVQGPQGEKGDTGLQGPQGFIGATGIKGSQGDQGAEVPLVSGKSLFTSGSFVAIPNTATWVALASPPDSRFVAPTTDAATYFVIFILFPGLLAQGSYPPVAHGGLRMKIKKFDGAVEVGDEDGTLRYWEYNTTQIPMPSEFVLQIYRQCVIPFFAVNNAGESGNWIPYYYSEVTGDGYAGSRGSMAIWFKL
jgi:hypothetical protein